MLRFVAYVTFEAIQGYRKYAADNIRFRFHASHTLHICVHHALFPIYLHLFVIRS